MNKDLLEPFVRVTTEKHGSPYKITETDRVINYCWEEPQHQYYNGKDKKDNSGKDLIEKIKEYIKTNGYVIGVNKWTEEFAYSSQVIRRFLSICYDKAKDKISLSQFEQGYGYSGMRTKDRIYPIRRNIPLLCFSKKIYAFLRVKTGARYQYKPRIYTGRYHQETLVPYLKFAISAGAEVLKMYLPYSYMENSHYPITAFYGYFDKELDVHDYVSLMEKTAGLEKEHDYNHLINVSKGRPVELLRMVKFRIDEKKDKRDGKTIHRQDLIYECAMFLREENWFDKQPVNELPF